MKKKMLSFTCRLGEVKDNLFTVQGSLFYFIPQNKDLLQVLKKWHPGTTIKVYCYKMGEDSQFFSVRNVKIDNYNQSIKYVTKRIKQAAAEEKLVTERNATRTKINHQIFRTDYWEDKRLEE
jgi:hypothetical protein